MLTFRDSYLDFKIQTLLRSTILTNVTYYIERTSHFMFIYACKRLWLAHACKRLLLAHVWKRWRLTHVVMRATSFACEMQCKIWSQGIFVYEIFRVNITCRKRFLSWQVILHNICKYAYIYTDRDRYIRPNIYIFIYQYACNRLQIKQFKQIRKTEKDTRIGKYSENTHTKSE